MAQANNVIMIVGRVGADPDMKYLDSNRSVTKFNVAVNRPIKDAEGNYLTDWFPCEFWGKQAETAAEYIKKGTLVSVVGSGKIEKWESNGEKKSRFVIHGDNFQLLSAKGSEGSDSHSSHAPAKATAPKHDDADFEDDIPPF